MSDRTFHNPYDGTTALALETQQLCVMLRTLQQQANHLRYDGRVSEELYVAFKVTSGALIEALLNPAAKNVGRQIKLRIGD